MGAMTEAAPMAIADLPISAISDKEMEDAFLRVVAEYKGAVASILRSMKDADEAYLKYREDGFAPDEAGAKKDRAALNRAEKNIAEQFATLKAAWEKPLADFEANIRDIRTKIAAASEDVGNAVKEYEQAQKSKKRAEIQLYFDGKGCDLIKLDQILDGKWLNKGAKMKEIQEEIDGRIANIYRDIEALERLPEHGMAAKAFYLQTLDMGAAMRQVGIMKENAERLAREQANREAREAAELASRNAAAEWRERQEAESEAMVQSLVDEAMELPAGTSAAQAREATIKATLTFEDTKERMRMLKEHMTANGYSYKKALLFDNDKDAMAVQKQKGIGGPILSLIYVPNGA